MFERVSKLKRDNNKNSSKANLNNLKTIQIPTYILKDRTLAVLESITEYLKEEKKHSYHEIAEILNRDDRTIWTVYYRAKQKRKNATRAVLISKTPKISLPSKIFQNRSLAVLEAAVEFLKEKKDMTYHEIASTLNRDDRTIWTVHSRTKKKRRQNERAK
ncbi:MAG: hypothetical protein KKH40_07830 [Nanoarchaeota archaeon]|nr:hypothetical protein [Nanoarchaeota archaeon]